MTDMQTSSRQQSERARKIEATILSALHRTGQVQVARAVGVCESKVSKWIAGGLQDVAAYLDAAGLKVVPQSAKCFDQKQINAIMTLAKQHLSQMESTDQLEWEES